MTFTNYSDISCSGPHTTNSETLMNTCVKVGGSGSPMYIEGSGSFEPFVIYDYNEGSNAIAGVKSAAAKVDFKNVVVLMCLIIGAFF